MKVMKIALDRPTFDPSKGETVTLSFEINRQANVQVIIYDRLGREVRRFDMPTLEAGGHSVKWDGRRTDNERAQGNVFLYTIEASDNRGRRFVYNPAKKSGGQLTKPLEFSCDRKTGKMEYVLPKNCMLRLRAGLKNGMLARTIFDWQPFTAGRHKYEWDGKDETGTMSLLNHPELDLNLTPYALPANIVIVTDPVPFESTEKSGELQAGAKFDPWAKKGKYFHYGHDPRKCHEPRFAVSFPGPKKMNEESVPIVSGVTPLRVKLDPRDEQHLIRTRFEVMVYVDGIFLFEMEEGTSPFTFNWKTKGLKKGPHVVTVNVMGYDGHIGVVSRKVIVEE